MGVLGDSFSEYYMGYLSRRFAASWRDTYENALTPALTEVPGCDILILQVPSASWTRCLPCWRSFDGPPGWRGQGVSLCKLCGNGAFPERAIVV